MLPVMRRVVSVTVVLVAVVTTEAFFTLIAPFIHVTANP